MCIVEEYTVNSTWTCILPFLLQFTLINLGFSAKIKMQAPILYQFQTYERTRFVNYTGPWP